MSDVEVIAGLGRHEAPALGLASTAARRSPDFDWRRAAVIGTLAAGDGLAAVACVALVKQVVPLAERSGAAATDVALVAPAALLVCLSLALGVYETARSNRVELFRMRGLATLTLATLLIIAFGEKLGPGQMLLGWAVLSLSLMVLGSVAAALAEAMLTRLDVWQTRVVLIGDATLTRSLSTILATSPSFGMRVLATAPHGDPRLLDLPTLCPERADLAVLMSSGDGREDARLVTLLDVPSVIVAHEAGDMQTLWLNTRTIGSAIGIEIRRSLVARNLRLKRALDLGGGLGLLVCAAPVVAVLAAAVWCVDRHNPFYAQTRIGRGGRTFRVWKIRSMFADAEARLGQHLAADPDARAEWARSFKLRRDPRILPGIGHVIRRSSLDELPQLWNVVRGDMSLVGPRPFPAYHLASFDAGFQSLRASVMPGLTGFWQITARSDGDLTVQRSADLFYVHNWSIWFDLYILFNTLPAVLLGKGAR